MTYLWFNGHIFWQSRVTFQKNPKNPLAGGFFWVGFLGGFFNANPVFNIRETRTFYTYSVGLHSTDVQYVSV